MESLMPSARLRRRSRRSSGGRGGGGGPAPDPADPTDPEDPTDPADPTDPEDPSDPTDPTDSLDPDPGPSSLDDPDCVIAMSYEEAIELLQERLRNARASLEVLNFNKQTLENLPSRIKAAKETEIQALQAQITEKEDEIDLIQRSIRQNQDNINTLCPLLNPS